MGKNNRATFPQQSWQYCQKALGRVSRTFAINIGALNGELHRAVLLAYLICRIIDTVEDSPSLSPKDKKSSLLQFATLIKSDGWKDLLSHWILALKEKNIEGNPNDIALLEQSFHAVLCFKHLSPYYRQIGERLFSTMANGKCPFVAHNHFIKDLKDLERYCYVVAGVVGEFLCESFLFACSIKGERTQTLRKHCVSFGLGLQMTNIAKDVLTDSKRRVCFLPESFLVKEGVSREEFLGQQKLGQSARAHQRLMQEAHGHLKNGLTFTLAIPRRHIRLRLFCIWPLWMAFETLKTLALGTGPLREDGGIKITRGQVKRILRSTSIRIMSNTLIERDFAHNYEHLVFAKGQSS